MVFSLQASDNGAAKRFSDSFTIARIAIQKRAANMTIYRPSARRGILALPIIALGILHAPNAALGQTPVGLWTFDQGTGTTATDTGSGAHNGTLQSGAAWTSTAKVGAYAINFPTSGNVDVSVPVVNTSQSFTAACWVKLNSTAAYETFMSIDGANVSGFFLQYNAGNGKISFNRLASDSVSAAATIAAATAAPTTGVWYHVAGVYDATAQTISLYVNGTLQQTVSFTTPWQATGHTEIGRGFYNAGAADYTNGSVDDARLYNSALSAAAIATLAGTGTATSSFPARVWQNGGTSDASDVTGAYVSQTSTTATILLSGGTTQVLTISTLGDEDKRYLKNILAVTQPFRSFTRNYLDSVGATHSETFQASLINITGFNSPLSKQQAVVVRQDSGQARGYSISDLSTADQTYVNSLAASFPAPPAPNDGASYAIRYDQYSPTSSPEPYNTYATDHFVWYWGNSIQSDATNWSNAAFRSMNFAYFEKVWNYFKSVNAPLPGWNSTKYKTNIYVTRTGLSVYPDGFAFGGQSIIIAPAAMLEGSSVIPHEFGHTMQMASGGFQSNDNVGWLWESHANWGADNFVPGLALALGVYAERAHYELESSRDNYGSWPFLQYFAEHPKFTPAFNFDIWKQALRNSSGAATEVPFQTMMRLGVNQGTFTGTGAAGFGDMIGEMAGHNATWDYTYQQGYNDTLVYLFTSGAPHRGRTILQAVPDRSGWYRPMYSQSPRQYGINLIDLTPTAGATSVTVNLDGIVDSTLSSNWRAQIVAINANGQARYSRMWKTGSGHMYINSSDVKLVLAITAAPDVYAIQPFRPGYNKVKRHFPYELQLTNCTPAAAPPGIRSHTGIAGSTFANGGGFVASSATVASTAYVGPNAQVLDSAQVLGTARIEDNATVMGNAIVSGTAVVGGYAVVRESAKVNGNARIREYAVIQDQTTITGNARVREAINVEGNGTVNGDAMVKGFGDLYTDSVATLGGGTIVGQDSEVRLPGRTTPVNYGTLYGYMDTSQLADPTQVVDNKYLSAHWDFAAPRTRVLIDALTDNDGELRGTAAFGTDGTRSVLNTDGTTGYATFEGSAIDTAGATFDMQIKWTGTTANQKVFAFGGPGGSLFFTPSNSSAKAAFTIVNGTTTQTVTATSAIPANAWERITIAYGGATCKIYLNGTQIGSSTTMTNTLDAIKATAGYLGRGADGTGFFKGEYYDLGIYRAAFASYAAMVPPYTRP